MERFFTTTDGWDAPIARDTERPLYSRRQVLTPRECAVVDGHLEALGRRLVPPPALTA